MDCLNNLTMRSNVCNKGFAVKGYMKKHMRVVHLSIRQSDNPSVENSELKQLKPNENGQIEKLKPLRDGRIECLNCNKTLSSKETARKHYKR